eukprot:COSAG01_NODE_41211_length_454_cov_1.067606_1_plen_40_part_10
MVVKYSCTIWIMYTGKWNKQWNELKRVGWDGSLVCPAGAG